MKQIVDKLNKIAKAIDENVELPTTDLIIDSLDAITRAYGGTPSESNLIVDKLEDIEEVAHGGITLNKYSLIDGNFTSMSFGDYGYGIYIPNTYVCARGNFHLVIDNVEVEGLQVFTGIAGSLTFGTSILNPTMVVSINILETGMTGTAIVVPDTEPTTHHVEFYYYSELPIGYQIVENNSNNADSLFVPGYALQASGEGGYYWLTLQEILPGYFSAPIAQIHLPRHSPYTVIRGENCIIALDKDKFDPNSVIGGTVRADLQIIYDTPATGITNNLIYYTNKMV